MLALYSDITSVTKSFPGEQSAQGKVSDLPKASPSLSARRFWEGYTWTITFFGYSRKQSMRNVLPFAHVNPTKDNPITLRHVACLTL